MLVEHTFVTTLDGLVAMDRAKTLLSALGYRSSDEGQSDELQFMRGQTRVSASTHFSKLPQRVHVSFDRGRINVAASIREHRKVHQLHRNLMLAVVSGLEATMKREESAEMARHRFDEVTWTIDQHFRTIRKKGRIACGCFLLFLVVAIGAIVYLVNSSR